MKLKEALKIVLASALNFQEEEIEYWEPKYDKLQKERWEAYNIVKEFLNSLGEK